jgi:hypothetical protein
LKLFIGSAETYHLLYKNVPVIIWMILYQMSFSTYAF